MGLLIKRWINDGSDCASGKNIGEWYFGEFPNRYNKENDKMGYLYLSMVTWYVSDYVKAAEMYRYLQKSYPECHEIDKRRIHDRLEAFAEMEKSAPAIECPDDDRLRATLHRLRYVFNAIDHPIRVYIAKSEEDYNDFHRRQFPNHEVYPYNTFVAAGFYHDYKEDDKESALWLVFKRDVIDDLDDEELTGLCAHEVAHFDLFCKGIPDLIRFFPELNGKYEKLTINNMMINERLTDLYVMGKGFAYSLYRFRLCYGASKHLLTAANIAEYIQKLD